MSGSTFRAVLWDIGGVITSGPFAAFERYERDHGLPSGFIRRVNSVDPDNNAWACLERSELTTGEFDTAFAAESLACGHAIPGRDVLPLLFGEVRPEMVTALETVKTAGFATACLTNNVLGLVIGPASIPEVMDRFDVIVESARVGVRKPERRFYEIACELLDVTPSRCVYLDDLGINLKPARAMGMTTIKVSSPDSALGELGSVLGIDLP